MVGDGGVDGGEHLQTSHPPEPQHRPLAPSERQVGILPPAVEPATGFLPIRCSKFAKGRAVGPQLVRYEDSTMKNGNRM